ncbi:MAG: PspA/IM30 family protein [Lentisphaeria bacterium]|nr:PspA/IM30 family protein [Lentisphaeria bacterium]
MASLLKAVNNWFRAKKDDAAKKLADPARDSQFAIEDSKTKVADFTGKIAKLVAESNRLRRQTGDAKADIGKWQGIAEKAASAENVDDARTALERKAQAEQRVKTLDAELVQNDQIVKQLREQLNRARAKIAQAESNRARLVARLEGSKVRKELAQASSEFNADGNPLAALDDLQKAVDTEESEAEAWEDMSGGGSVENQLEERYESASDSAVDAELQALMSKNKKG